ncbi:MAG TPA: O-antigen ligase family protein [Pyrinomonadaceae bacterium]|jgi:probable O-glycosylation ligase (exosortase A-associated)
MGYRRQPSDYEPVTPAWRPPTDPAHAPDASVDDHWFAPQQTQDTDAADHVAAAGAFSASDTHPPLAAQPIGEPASEPTSPVQTAQQRQTRGHLFTFAGLFLFTLVVYVRPYELFDALAGFTSMAFWVAACTLAVFFPTQFMLAGNLTARPREINLVLLLGLTGLLSIPLAQDPARSWTSFVEFLKVVTMFIVMINAVRTERRLKALILLALAVSCVLAAGAINDFRTGNLVMAGKRIAGTIKGLFDNPNDLALHLVTMIPLAVALLLGTRNPFKKLLYGACALLLLGGMVATFSRGGFLGLVAATLVLVWKIGRQHRLAICALVLVLVPLFVLLVPSSYGGRLSTTSDDSALTRRDDLKKSIIVSLRHPLFGIGMDNYVLYSNTEHATHNAYTQVSAEMGLAALVFYVMFVTAPFRRLRQIERATSGAARRSRFYYLAVGLQASLVGYMVSSFFASVAFVWYIYYLVSYAACLHRIYEASPDAARVASNSPEELHAPAELPAQAYNGALRESEALN